MKRCSHCKKELPTSEFYKNRAAYDGLANFCKNCHREAVKTNRENNKEHYNAYARQWKQGVGKAKHLMSMAKSRAKKQGLPFNIVEDDIDIPDVCPVLGIPLESGKGAVSPSSPTIDRIVPDLGYVAGNVQVMSQLANRMKSDATPEQLLTFADWIYKTYGGI